MSNNLTTLLTIAAELRSGGLPWERVAERATNAQTMTMAALRLKPSIFHPSVALPPEKRRRPR